MTRRTARLPSIDWGLVRDSFRGMTADDWRGIPQEAVQIVPRSLVGRADARFNDCSSHVAPHAPKRRTPHPPKKGAMGVHSNITPRNYAPYGCAARFAATRPHNWRDVQVLAVRVRCREPCKVRLTPERCAPVDWQHRRPGRTISVDARIWPDPRIAADARSVVLRAGRRVD